MASSITDKTWVVFCDASPGAKSSASQVFGQGGLRTSPRWEVGAALVDQAAEVASPVAPASGSATGRPASDAMAWHIMA